MINNDTTFCFTIRQSKEIAKHLSLSLLCESKIKAQQEAFALQQHTLAIKEDIILTLKQKVINLQMLADNKEFENQELNTIIKNQNFKLKRSRKHKILMGIGLGVITFLAISN